jgi:MFS family permease
VYSTVVPRYPEIKDELDLTNAALGTAVGSFALGALLAGLLASVLVTRYSSSRVATGGMLLLAVVVASIAVVPTWVALAAVLFVAGGLDAIVDVAQNAHGLRVQRRYGRSIVNSFHGTWSIGAVTGGLLGALAAGLNVPVGRHLAVSAVAVTVVVLVGHRHLLSGPDTAEREPEPQPAVGQRSAGTAGSRRTDAVTRRALLLLGVLAACGAVVEDAGSSWGALYLRSGLGTATGTAGLAFVALQSAMTVGRLLGDRVVDRHGERAVVRTGGVVTAASMGAALVVATPATAIAGFALAGLGVAVLVPATMHAADELPGLAPGAGLTVVSWLLRVGFLVSAPLVGLVADATSLRHGLLGVVAAGLVVAVLGRVLPGRRRRPADDEG